MRKLSFNLNIFRELRACSVILVLFSVPKKAHTEIIFQKRSRATAHYNKQNTIGN